MIGIWNCRWFSSEGLSRIEGNYLIEFRRSNIVYHITSFVSQVIFTLGCSCTLAHGYFSFSCVRRGVMGSINSYRWQTRSRYRFFITTPSSVNQWSASVNTGRVDCWRVSWTSMPEQLSSIQVDYFTMCICVSQILYARLAPNRNGYKQNDLNWWVNIPSSLNRII